MVQHHDSPNYSEWLSAGRFIRTFLAAKRLRVERVAAIVVFWLDGRPSGTWAGLQSTSRVGIGAHHLGYNLTRVVRKQIQMSNTRSGARRRDLHSPKGQAVQQEWQLQDAKARFSEVFRLARERGPQRVTKHGREAVVVIPAEEYTRLTQSEARKGSLSEFFAASPLCGSGIDLDRPRDFGRDIQL